MRHEAQDVGFGAMESFGMDERLPGGREAWKQFRSSVDGYASWDDPDLKEIVCLRLLSEPGTPVWDVSYCYGTMKNGSNVNVQLPFSQLRKGRINADILEHAKKDGVYAKGLGIFDAISTCN